MTITEETLSKLRQRCNQDLWGYSASGINQLHSDLAREVPSLLDEIERRHGDTIALKIAIEERNWALGELRRLEAERDKYRVMAVRLAKGVEKNQQHMPVLPTEHEASAYALWDFLAEPDIALLLKESEHEQ